MYQGLTIILFNYYPAIGGVFFYYHHVAFPDSNKKAPTEKSGSRAQDWISFADPIKGGLTQSLIGLSSKVLLVDFQLLFTYEM